MKKYEVFFSIDGNRIWSMEIPASSESEACNIGKSLVLVYAEEVEK